MQNDCCDVNHTANVMREKREVVRVPHIALYTYFPLNFLHNSFLSEEKSFNISYFELKVAMTTNRNINIVKKIHYAKSLHIALNVMETLTIGGRQHSFVVIDHEIFSTVILSLPLIQEGQLSASGERMCTILVNSLED